MRDLTTLYSRIEALPYHGRLHCHSENSLKDSFNKVGDMANKAKSLGFDSLALTDHGNIAGWIQHMKACKAAGVRPVFGVEAYLKDILSDVVSKDDENNISHVGGKADTKLHLILIGLDDIGRKAVSLIVTESNAHIEKRGNNVYPCIDKEILEKYIAPGTAGHKHVVVTSACVGGVLAGRVYQNDAYIEELTSIDEKLRMHEENSGFLAMAQARLADVQEVYDQAKEWKNRTYTARIRAIEKREDGPEKEQALAEIREEEKKTEIARENFDRIKADLARARADMKQFAGKILPEDDVRAKRERKAYLESQVMTQDEIRKKFEQEALYYDSIAGHGYFFIELQYHGLPMEKLWMPVLNDLAHKLSIPTVAANDEHMIEREDTEARKYLNAMRFYNFRYEEPSDSDYELYFKSDEELTDALVSMLGKEEDVYEAFSGISQILSMCDEGTLEKGEHYPKWNKDWTKEESLAFLEKLAREGIPKRYPEWTDELEDRLQYELSVIRDMGFADYFLVVQWYINVGKKLGHMPDDRFRYLQVHVTEMDLESILSYIEADQSLPGYAVGPGRGSGAASIVCYLTGMTAIDPIRFNLVFERFLNPERVTMPDIDVDFSQHIRDLLIQIMRAKFGNDGICTIMTRGTMAAKNAIKQTAKVYGAKKHPGEKDAHKTFLSLGDAMAKLVPAAPGAKLADADGDIMAEFGDNDDAMAIYKIAKKLEGTYSQTGQHAAGVVLADNGDIKQYTALFNIDGAWVSQMDKTEVEEYGMLKFDFLGLINLDIITDTVRDIAKHNPGVSLDLDNLPIEKDVIKLFAEGNTNRIFQFESPGMKKTLRQFHPESLDDLILLNALYRPGPMDQIPKVVKAKREGVVTYKVSQLEPILKSTYGFIVYQEQVQQIFRDLAGYSLGGADLVRRAMSKKKEKELAAQRQIFIYGDESKGIPGCVKNGVSEKDANEIFDTMMEFAAYGFNLAHAAAYSYVAYITGYLKQYYTAEFFRSAMRYTSIDVIQPLVKECKDRNIEVRNPDINISQESLELINDSIYFGLGDVKSAVGSAPDIIREREENGPFTDITDFLIRTNCKKDVFVSLACAGAFDNICPGRYDLISNANDIVELVSSMASAGKELREKLKLAQLIEDGKDDEAREMNGGKKPNMKVLARTVARLQNRIADAKEMMAGINRHYSIPDPLYLMQKETEAIGTYLTTRIFNGYEDVAQAGGKKLESVDNRADNVKLLVYPDNVSVRTTKNGKTFASFDAVTKFGTIRGITWDEDVAEKLTSVHDPVIMSGALRADDYRDGQMQLAVKSFSEAKKAYKDIHVKVRNLACWVDLCEKAKEHQDQDDRIIAWTADGEEDYWREANLIVSHATIDWMEENGIGEVCRND